MYCPRCAAPNIDGAKYCRGCGTNLENVALALSEPAAGWSRRPNKVIRAKSKDWIEKRREAMNNLTKGVGMVTASALLLAALGIFSNDKDWIIIWLVLVGWLTCFGVYSITAGISNLLESRFIRRQLTQTDEEPGEVSLRADRTAGFIGPDTAPNLTLPPSVTENTTNLLTKPEP